MLNEQKCEACSIDAIALNKDEQQSLLLELSDWISKSAGSQYQRIK